MHIPPASGSSRQLRVSTLGYLIFVGLAGLLWLSASAAAGPPIPASPCCGRWSEETAAGPSPRFGAAMAYDSTRRVVVLFGGFEAGVRHGDTWEWDGASWTQVATTGPSPRLSHGMVYDEARQRTLLFGGFEAGFFTRDTWEWDGATWTEVTPAAGNPAVRASPAMAYDSVRERVVLFGGLGTGLAKLGDTWEWDGGTWTQVAITGPAPRERAGMTYDPVRGVSVLFGGLGGTFLGDTWEWDGTSWTQVDGAGPARSSPGMAYAASCEGILLFGGEDGSLLGDTWSWDGVSWTEVPVAGPSPRTQHAVAYDGARKRLLLFGGSTSGGGSDETWVYDTGSPHVFRGGRLDDLAPPVDPATRSAALEAAFPAAVWSAFDDPTLDRFFGHTLFQLPAGIVRARLLIKMRPNGGFSSNDVLHLGLEGSGFAWGSPISALPEAGGTWAIGSNPATVFDLDLGDLPGGVSLIAKLEAEGLLDVLQQDDTAVDWMHLMVWTCPPKVAVSGWPFVSLGNGILEPTPNGLQVTGFLGGGDGFEVATGDLEGICLGIEDECPSGWAMGSAMSIAATGGTIAEPVRLSELDFVAAGSAIDLVTDFSPGQPNPPNPCIWTQICLDDQTVADACVPDGAVASVAPEACIEEVDWLTINDQSSGFSILFADPVEITLADGTTATGDRLKIFPDFVVPITPRLTAFELTASGVPDLVVEAVAAQAFRRLFRPLGSASFAPGPESLAVIDLGQGGSDGVAMELGRAESAMISLDPIESVPGVSAGSYLEARATGSVDGVEGEPLGSIRILREPAPSTGLRIDADFSDIGSPTQRILVLADSAVVVEITGHSGTAAIADRWPRGLGKLGGGPECYAGHFPPGTTFLIDGQPYVGDELRVLAEGTSASIDYKTELALVASGIAEIGIVGARVEPHEAGFFGDGFETGDFSLWSAISQ